MNAINNKTCTVVVGGDAYWCGKPAVASFVARSGVTYYECAEHAVPYANHAGAATPVRQHPPTRTTRPYVLVRDGEIVGYAEAVTIAVERRARRLGAKIVPVVR